MTSEGNKYLHAATALAGQSEEGDRLMRKLSRQPGYIKQSALLVLCLVFIFSGADDFRGYHRYYRDYRNCRGAE